MIAADTHAIPTKCNKSGAAPAVARRDEPRRFRKAGDFVPFKWCGGYYMWGESVLPGALARVSWSGGWKRRGQKLRRSAGGGVGCARWRSVRRS